MELQILWETEVSTLIVTSYCNGQSHHLDPIKSCGPGVHEGISGEGGLAGTDQLWTWLAPFHRLSKACDGIKEEKGKTL